MTLCAARLACAGSELASQPPVLQPDDAVRDVSYAVVVGHDDHSLVHLQCLFAQQLHHLVAAAFRLTRHGPTPFIRGMRLSP